MKADLLIIDPQVDFSDPVNGSLYVNGAEKDIERLATFLDKFGSKLSNVRVTLDQHQEFDIAHPVFWVDRNGNNPNPFTEIQLDAFFDGFWAPSEPGLYGRCKQYLEQLESSKRRHKLTIWPPHCRIGTPGANVMEPLAGALSRWARSERATIDYVAKGSYPLTEHYSALKAEVPDPSVPETQLNRRLIEALDRSDIVLIAGEALSHCVANTVFDIADNFGPSSVKKLVLLEDASNSVTGFEHIGEQFVEELKGRGMQVSTTRDFSF